MTMHKAIVVTAVEKAAKGTLKDKPALIKLISEAAGDPAKTSDIVTEDGRLIVTVNLGPPPALLNELEELRRRERDRNK